MPELSTRPARAEAKRSWLAGKPERRWLTRLDRNSAIAIFGLALIGVVWGGVISAVQYEREEAIENVIRQNSNLAKAFEEQTIRTIKGVDAAALFIAREYARLGTAMNLAQYADDGYIDGKLFDNIYVINERGDLVLSSHSFKATNLADREHFKVHIQGDTGKLFINKPLLGRASGKWTIHMTRRINMPDGSFGGIVSMAVDPGYFSRFYQQTDLGKFGLVNLVGLDGISRARLSGQVASFGTDMTNSDLLRGQAKSGIGNFLSAGRTEGIARYVSFRTIPGYPLVVAVGTSRDEFLATFSQRSDQYYWAALLVSAVIVLFSVLLRMTIGRQTLAEAQFRTTFEQVAVGIAHTTLDSHYLLVNQRFCDMLGYTRDDLIAMNPNEVSDPDDQDGGVYFKQMLAGEIDTHSDERRYVRKDRSMLWVNHTVSLARDSAGRPLYFIRVVEDITDRKQLQRALHHQAHHDGLTGLPNRELIYDRLMHALDQARRRNWITGVMFIDLDRFKAVNDTLGHGAGDNLLQQVSARLTQCVRADDTVGRIGGDEFAVILSELARDQDGGRVAQKIIDALAKPFQIDGSEIFISASIGIAICPPDDNDADGLISNADAAMYEAKKQGRNNFQFYSAALNERATGKVLLERALHHALARNEFVLHYQPKVSLRTGRITGVEALLRWQRSDGRLMAPAEFIPLLEESGMIVPVGEWVLRTACAQMRAWQDGGVAPVPISVNLSAKQFHQQNVCEIVATALRDYALDARYLEIEITESAAMQDVEATTIVLHNLKALGVGVAIDDFGTGYSSLSYLKRFPIDSLKIDRSFVTDLPDNQDDASIVKAMITMAHALRLRVTAEGVETEAQLEFLAATACNEMQGYYFSRPLSTELCTQFLREQRKLPLRAASARSGLRTVGAAA
jgi:diguanylate cyclase (GGDEF)-like protein/PAS domain S-box-containing protein